MPPPAILNINEGEKIYKCMKSDWQVDEGGPIMFRFISKLRKDGKVELVLFSQRQDNTKFIYGTLEFMPDEFAHAYQTIRETVWGFFPNAKMEVEEFEKMAPSAYTTAKISSPWYKVKLGWIWHVGGFFNKLRWFFTRKTPK